MAKITIACAALSNRIYAGRVNKAGDAFLDGKQDVTSDVLKAVIDKIKPGHIETVTVDGIPRFEIEVREGASKKWVMHVIGPDEIHDMPDEITALREANKLNKNILKWRTEDPSPHDPFMVALVKNLEVEEA